MITSLLLTLLDLFRYALFIRLIVDYARIFAPNWRPKSFLIAFFEFVGRFVPPLRLGGVAIDLSFIVLLIGISLAQNIIAEVSKLS